MATKKIQDILVKPLVIKVKNENGDLVDYIIPDHLSLDKSKIIKSEIQWPQDETGV